MKALARLPAEAIIALASSPEARRGSQFPCPSAVAPAELSGGRHDKDRMTALASKLGGRLQLGLRTPPAAVPPAAAHGVPPAASRPPARSGAATEDCAAPRANAPAGWKALAAATASCEPEDDGDLLGWMAGEVAGMAGYGEALIEVCQSCVNSVGLDPAAMAAVHDAADAAAGAATAMACARQKFASHYAEVREFAGNGGVLPYDGRWMRRDAKTACR